ncbi:MAG TPA: NAD-dependent epimerase/dehydratase family protein [Symbiobacteriaceae bacterium]|nr:NAD-dependent epimerase/dehydratase family protein [Symbiobacteriaceae bacterium]
MSWQGKRVLVTGANGFVGSRVAVRLAEAGAQVRALVRRPGESELLQRPGIEEMEGSFMEPQVAMDAVTGMDVVVHTAGGLGKDLDDARALNRDGTHTMAAAALAAGVDRFIHISTGSVYAPTTDQVLTESHPLKTSGDTYGWTKAEADEEIFAFIERGLKATILRPTAILGFHPTSSWGFKAPNGVKNGKFRLLGDGLNSMGYIHIENLVDVVGLAVANPVAIGQAYTLVDGHTTWKAYTDEIRGWFGAPELAAVPFDQIPAGAYWQGEFSNAKLKADLGYEPRLSYADGMAEAETWWKAQS